MKPLLRHKVPLRCQAGAVIVDDDGEIAHDGRYSVATHLLVDETASASYCL